MIDKSKREDGTFSREDFTFDHERNLYVCPANKTLAATGTLVNDEETLLYLASTSDCRGCMFKAQCCPKAPFRRISRSICEEARGARARAKTEAFGQSRRDRKRVEILFAHSKRILRLGRLRLQGPCGAQFEFMLAAIAQNLRTLAKLIGRAPQKVVACGALLGGCQSNSLNTAAPPERMSSNGLHKSLRSLCSLITDFWNKIGQKRFRFCLPERSGRASHPDRPENKSPVAITRKRWVRRFPCRRTGKANL